MVSLAKNRGSISEDEAALELGRLREAAKLAAIYYSVEGTFKKRTDLAHIVHASLHCAQFIITSAAETFHHLHHYTNECAREQDTTIPELPEERNIIFFLYPFCMLVSLVFAILWLCKIALPQRPLIPLVACATQAVLMLATGIMEMKHAHTYLDLSQITDEELLEHPIFIHNFVMCILSVFVMTIYLVQVWILYDYYLWSRRERDRVSTSTDVRSSISSTDETGSSSTEKQIDENVSRQQAIELAPIPTFEDLSIPAVIADSVDKNEEPIIYCCCVDWCNYIRMKMESKPRHEFQVIHVM